MSSRPFVHLHCHSHYRLLDGASKLPALVKRAKALGMPAIAVTDHGNLHGAVEFLREAKAVDLKPIIGMEAYVAPGRRTTRPLKVAAYDFGMKWNILRRLTAHGCSVRVFPADTPARELLATGPDGVFLSNGPGDPAPLEYAIDNAKTLVDSSLAKEEEIVFEGNTHHEAIRMKFSDFCRLESPLIIPLTRPT